MQQSTVRQQDASETGENLGHKTVIRSAMQYVAGTGATMKQQEKRIEVNKTSPDATVDARSDTQLRQDQERTHPRKSV